jgi:predicted ATPase
MKIIVLTGLNNDLLYKFQDKNYEDPVLLDFPERDSHPSQHFKSVKKMLKNADTFGWTEICVITHSEHVINGLRIYSMTNEVDIKIFFVEENKTTEIDIDNNGNLTKFPRGFMDQNSQDLATLIKLKQSKLNVKEITIDKRGDLSEWPDGFFDQAEQDYLKILKLRK